MQFRMPEQVGAARRHARPGVCRPVGRAAQLAKADLQSRLVNEFPELQGIAGRYYATHAGEGSAEEAGGESAPEQGPSEQPKGDSGLWTPPGSSGG